MTASRQRTGRLAEQIVAERLAAAGWEIVDRNARTRHGELDLVALDRATLVFVEVKAARAGAVAGPERPAVAVGPRKQHRIRRLAAAWMAAHRDLLRYAEIRCDVVGLTLDRSGRVLDYEHIEGAF